MALARYVTMHEENGKAENQTARASTAIDSAPLLADYCVQFFAIGESPQFCSW
jgi:hypothetical protein